MAIKLQEQTAIDLSPNSKFIALCYLLNKWMRGPLKFFVHIYDNRSKQRCLACFSTIKSKAKGLINSVKKYIITTNPVMQSTCYILMEYNSTSYR